MVAHILLYHQLIWSSHACYTMQVTSTPLGFAFHIPTALCVRTISVDAHSLLSKGGAGLAGVRTPVPVKASWNQAFLALSYFCKLLI